MVRITINYGETDGNVPGISNLLMELFFTIYTAPDICIPTQSVVICVGVRKAAGPAA